MFRPMFYILQKYFSQFLVVFNITSEDEGTVWYFSNRNLFKSVTSYEVVTLYHSAYFSHFVTASYRVFSHNVTAAILVSQNSEMEAMFVSQTSPVGVEFFSYANAFFCSNKFA